MAELKTRPNDGNVIEFLEKVENDKRRMDSFKVLELFEEITGKKPVMWGNSIVGFGRYRYSYPSGGSAEWLTTGFSPRKQSLTLYIMPGFDKYDELMSKIGKHKTGVSCLYINKLEDIDMDVLKELVTASYNYMDKKYGVTD